MNNMYVLYQVDTYLPLYFFRLISPGIFLYRRWCQLVNLRAEIAVSPCAATT